MEPLAVAGIRLGTTCAGIKYPDRRDLVVIEAAAGTRAAAVFTRNAFCAAPVIVARTHLAAASPRYLVINTGNANAGTGRQGLVDAEASCRALAERAGCRPEEVLPFSTGVIGEPLPLYRVVTGLPAALAALRPDGWIEAAHGIMTTDTRPKWASRRLSLDGRDVTVTGIAKGAGMICPDMATLLAFVATDAAVDEAVLRSALTEAVAESFNAITVDGDTSTNDSFACCWQPASPGRAYRPKVKITCVWLTRCARFAVTWPGDHPRWRGRDQVHHRADRRRPRRGRVPASRLCHRAFAAGQNRLLRLRSQLGPDSGGGGPGRAGGSGHRPDNDPLGRGLHRPRWRPYPGYTEERGQQVMARPEITIRVELNRGEAAAHVWTTDLSFDYVRINAEYRT